MRFSRMMMGAALAALGGAGATLMKGVPDPVPAEVKAVLRRSRGAENKRDHGVARSRYMPHQGPRECARRVRQMAKAGWS